MSTSSLVVGPGYVGWPLSLNLVSEGQVFVLSRNPRQQPGISPIVGDLQYDPSFSLPPIDRLFYLPAAKSNDPQVYRGVYLEGLRKILASLPQAPKTLIYVSSTSVYGQSSGEWVNEDQVGGEVDEKRAILKEAEQVVLRQSGIVVRFGGIYGPGRTRFIDRIITGDIALSNQAHYTNRIHRDDCVRALLFLIEKGHKGEVYNGVDNDPADRSSIVHWAHHILGKKSRTEVLQEPTPKGKRVMNRKLTDLGFKFCFPTFREGYEDHLRSHAGKA